jgi:endonuclease-3
MTLFINMKKKPHDIDEMMKRIRAAVQPFPKAALFELYEEGSQTPFEQLVACMISIRTLDEVTLPVSRRLFSRARTPEAIAALSIKEIETLIHPSTFYERKAMQIRALAQRVVDEYGGELPCDAEVMMSFSGVGLKCTNLTLGIACGQMRVSADVHVHRVTNRWGYVSTSSPEATSQALENKLPRKYRVEINRLLVPFGKHICTGRLPHCSTCPVLDYCQQVGVGEHR